MSLPLHTTFSMLPLLLFAADAATRLSDISLLDAFFLMPFFRRLFGFRYVAAFSLMPRLFFSMLFAATLTLLPFFATECHRRTAGLPPTTVTPFQTAFACHAAATLFDIFRFSMPLYSMLLFH